ncbi:hypothetical protein DFQ28_011485 [Apophysomyces sp. BC1034]|nr:hypothetical protein DFQ30_011495 [Apophysomyces sp. BC1015]KAG0168720.1 hypothetical protein DFQ29_010047 [Apophysomyces sp. BC1021]KAG0184262.1 hypothetical protein DFQ28_011485 [Apophysomyces sp. BC1034]
MSLRLLTARVIRPYASAVQKSAIRAYATKKYSKDHEWISVENGVGTIGLTHHAQELLGDVVFVETPTVGDKCSAGDAFGTVESVKAASDVFSPVSGEVVGVNQVLAETPDLINSNPEDEGWIAKVKLSEPEQLDELLDEKAYKAFVAEE